MYTLSTQAFMAIKRNGELFGKIADTLNISPLSMDAKIRKRHPDFTQIAVIKLIKEYTGMTDTEILEDTTKVPA
jgi:hypothetical protein